MIENFWPVCEASTLQGAWKKISQHLWICSILFLSISLILSCHEFWIEILLHLLLQILSMFLFLLSQLLHVWSTKKSQQKILLMLSFPHLLSPLKQMHPRFQSNKWMEVRGPQQGKNLKIYILGQCLWSINIQYFKVKYPEFGLFIFKRWKRLREGQQL